MLLNQSLVVVLIKPHIGLHPDFGLGLAWVVVFDNDAPAYRLAAAVVETGVKDKRHFGHLAGRDDAGRNFGDSAAAGGMVKAA